MVSIESLKILKYNAFSKKALISSITCSKCKNKTEKTFKKKELIETFKIYSYFKNMIEENISREFRSKNADETKNYFF